MHSTISHLSAGTDILRKNRKKEILKKVTRALRAGVVTWLPPGKIVTRALLQYGCTKAADTKKAAAPDHIL